MSVGTGKVTPRLSVKQAKTIRLIKDRVAAGEEISNTLLIECHDQAYGLEGDRKTASTYAGVNMKRAAFLSALSLDASESQQTLKDVLWSWLLNYEAMPDLAKTAAKLLAKSALGEKVHVTYDEGEFSGKTTADLEYYGKHQHWPEEAKLHNIPKGGTIQ